MSYGWRRTELLGGLSNGLFLLSMSTFIFLQAIPSFISPPSGKGENEKHRKATGNADMVFLLALCRLLRPPLTPFARSFLPAPYV